MLLLFFSVSFLASVVGAICGIGGGVIIKPVLDLIGGGSVSTISFLSSCTVLSMSCYSVVRSFASGDRQVDVKVGTPLALGAVAGGILGNQLFLWIRSIFADPNTVGAVQAACLALVTMGTALYTLFKDRIRGRRMNGIMMRVLIGVFLGLLSSLLGIGGGPINLVVLFFFFGMDTKTAASYSLYIILFSQISNLLTTVIGGSVPAFDPWILALMMIGGIGGGMLGRKINKRIDGKTVDKLFLGLMVVIICISLYNVWKYAG